jgi:hypothetical protein
VQNGFDSEYQNTTDDYAGLADQRAADTAARVILSGVINEYHHAA